MSVSPVLKAYVETPYGQVHHRYSVPSAGSVEKPLPIVFLHKSASSSASYEKLMLLYATKGYRCYAPDMPGFGGSFDPSPAAITEIQDSGTRWYVELFMSVFRTLDLYGEGKKIHLAGHHSGAVLSIEIAAIYPDFVSSALLVGATIMDDEERAAMKQRFFAPFNEPVADGSHLLKTWNYLGGMGIGDDLELWQCEAIDHIRAWKGRNQIYGAVWKQDAESLYMKVRCKMLILCARDDVLWPFFGRCRELRPEVEIGEIAGGNFELERDAEGIATLWSPFIEREELWD